jgi:hypothetical protein
VSLVSPISSHSLTGPDEQRNVLDWHRKFSMGMKPGTNNLQTVMEDFTEDDLARVQEIQNAKLPGTKRIINVNNYKHQKIVPILPAVAGDDDTALTASNSTIFFTGKKID